MSNGNGSVPSPPPQWWLDAIIYELHIRAYTDSNGDGNGDFDGLTSRLDYLHDLGITAIWVLPFYPSPRRDDGYDIADYRRVDPMFGDMRAFRRFLRAAHDRDIRVITELVLNHTSDQHPWFQRARRAPAGSRYRNYYVWSDTWDRYREARIIFQDFESSNWAWDPVAQAYYWHRFYSHQPDLNYDNPEVKREVFSILDFWLGMGVDGVRLDAVPYLYEREGTTCENLPETHAFLKELRAYVDARYPNRLLLAEANQWPEDAAAYFGDGDECHMNFHFPLMPRLFMALRQENRLPIVDILEQTPPLPPGCAWATFLRNHDELTLEMVTDEERDYMWRAYASDPQMRLNLGIRRRLAPLLGNDRRKIELLNVLLFSLPGTPVIYYGDEIGMGDNVYLGDRDGVRTPMQWSPDRNAGFSRTSTQRLYLPPIQDGPYHYETVNVETQRHDPHSLLSFTRQLISVRKRHPVLSRGELTFLDPENHRVLAFLRHVEGEHSILVVANLSARAQPVQLDLRPFIGSRMIEVFGRTTFPAPGEWPYQLTLQPYGYHWFELVPAAVEADTGGETPIPTLPGTWPRPLEGRNPSILGPLGNWIRRRRWFAGKAREVASISLRSVVPLPQPGVPEPVRLCFVSVEYTEGEPDSYVVPLAVLEGERARIAATFHRDAVIATLHDGRVVVDAMSDEESVLAIVHAMAGRRGLNSKLVAEPSRELRTLVRSGNHQVRILSVEQSNSSVAIDDTVMIKVVRRLHGGVNPDLEISRHLSEQGFQNSPALLGSLSWKEGREPESVAVAYQYVPHDRDAWGHFLDAVDIYYDTVLATPRAETMLTGGAEHEQPAPLLGASGPELELLGRRTAELHLALAAGDDPRFAPEPFTAFYQRSLYQGVRTQLRTTLGMLRRRRNALDGAASELAEAVLSGQQSLLGRIGGLLGRTITAKRIRTHGDYHLGQVLYTGRDFVIIDFEGEPARSLGERRIKHSALRDVAGMLRSFDYAAQMSLVSRRERGLIASGEEPIAQLWADAWREAAAAAFLRGYLETEGIGNLLPPEEDLHLLLDVFLLEKALYEVRYELDNRPTWAHVPLRVLAARARELEPV